MGANNKKFAPIACFLKNFLVLYKYRQMKSMAPWCNGSMKGSNPLDTRSIRVGAANEFY